MGVVKKGSVGERKKEGNILTNNMACYVLMVSSRLHMNV